MDEIEFGRYRLLSVIGEGGMGTVYRAHDSVIGRYVAVKVLPTEMASEPGYQERFRREAHTAARLTEPHIIPIYDTGEIDGRLYLVMPIIDGTDVHNLLQRNGPMNPQRAVHIVEQLASALGAAHAVGLVHRDVKPSNALVTGRDFAYLIDFGIAHDASATKLTNTGTIVGTMAYMAPERFTSGVSDARSDVYSLACVLHECLSGAQPYPGQTMEQQIAGHLSMDPPRPSAHRPDIPSAFDEVVATGMAKNPEQRYRSADELASAARQALSATSSRPRSAPTLGPTPYATPPLLQQPTVSQMTAAPQQQMPWPAAGLPQPVQQPYFPPVPPPPPRRRNGAVIALVVAAVVTVVVALTGAIGYSQWKHSQGSPTSNPTAESSSPSIAKTTTPAVQPVEEAALDGFLLSADQISAELGTTGMGIVKTRTGMYDNSPNLAVKACLPLSTVVEKASYDDSGWSAAHGNKVKDSGNSFSHLADQFVVLLPSAAAAKTFFNSSVERWSACSNQQYTFSESGQNTVWSVGQVANANGVLSATLTQVSPALQGSWNCQRALTAANNVVIDVQACVYNSTGAGVRIAQEIAAKVPST